MAKKTGLGRGFESLIPTDLVATEFDVTESEKNGRLTELPLDAISPNPGQPRRDFNEEELGQLAQSMAQRGLLQPIVVNRVRGKYQIVAGERRWRAAKLLGWKKIPAIVRTMSEQKQLELSIIENLQRANLNMFETATAYAKLKSEFNLETTQIAKIVGVAARSVYVYMSLLKFTAEQRQEILQRGINLAVATCIAELPTARQRGEALKLAIAKKWRQKDARAYVDKVLGIVRAEKTFTDSELQDQLWAQEFTARETSLNRRYNQYGARVHVCNHGRTLNFICDTKEQARALMEFFAATEGRPADVGQETKTIKKATAGVQPADVSAILTQLQDKGMLTEGE